MFKFKLFILLSFLIFINICFSQNNNQGLVIREGETSSNRGIKSFVVVLINTSKQDYNNIFLKCGNECNMSKIQITGITKNGDTLVLPNLAIGKSYTFTYSYSYGVNWKIY